MVLGSLWGASLTFLVGLFHSLCSSLTPQSYHLNTVNSRLNWHAHSEEQVSWEGTLSFRVECLDLN